MIEPKEFKQIEEYMEGICEVWMEREVNDFFWFHTETIACILGFENFEEMCKQRRES